MDFHNSQPVELIIPASFYTQIESKKWSDRKDALAIIEKATEQPAPIIPGDFNELVRILKKVISKDANIVVATAAIKCLAQLAQGLRENFSPYANSSLCILFEKFKEKKPNVVSALREAADAAFIGTNIEDIYEDVIQFLDNKNPQIKSEMCAFLERLFAKHPKQVMNKKTLRPLMNALVKTLSDMDATVRDNSACAIGTAMKTCGEKIMMSLIPDLEPIKLAKIKEFCEQAVIVQEQSDNVEYANNQVNDHNTNNIMHAQDANQDDEVELDPFDLAEPIVLDVPANVYTQIESKKWSDRKDALAIIEEATKQPAPIVPGDFNELVRILKKVISKDANIVVATAAIKCLAQLAQGLRENFSPYANSSLCVLFEKFKEKKPNVVSALREAADAAFIGTNIEDIYEDVIQFLDNKNPQIKSEMCAFLERLFAKHPSQVMNKKTLRPLINALVKTLSDMDATVRDNSACAIGTAMKVCGEKVMMSLIPDIEPIKLTKIKEYFEKAVVKKLPKSIINSLNPPQQQPTMNQMPISRSSATMVRSTSGTKLKSKIKTVVKSAGYGQTTTRPNSQGNLNALGGGEALKQPASRISQCNPSATVRRTATIVKPRASIVPKPSAAVMSGKTNGTNYNNVTSTPMGMSTPVAPNCQAHINNENHNNFHGPLTPPAPNLNNQVEMTQNDILDCLMGRMSSQDIELAITAFEKFSKMLSSMPKDNIFIDKVGQVILLCSLQLRQTNWIYHDSKKANPSATLLHSSVHMIKAIAECVDILASNRLLSTLANNPQPLSELIVQTYILMNTCFCSNNNDTPSKKSFEPFEDSETVNKSLSSITASCFEAVDTTRMIEILTRLLNEYDASPLNTETVELVKSAVIKSLRLFEKSRESNIFT